jgi:hypothetical protein
MRRIHAPTPIAIIGIAGGLMILLAYPAQRIHSAVPTIKVPGPYPYETPVQVPVPASTISESSVLPTPAPFPYLESSSALPAAPDHVSRTANARRPVTAKAVREAAFKYNGVPDFCEFLAALPANVSVFDPNLGRTRTLVQGGRVIHNNAAWLGKRKQARLKPDDRTLVSVEELGKRNPGI